jgi:hypothetical protein
MDEVEEDVLAHELPRGALGAAALHQLRFLQRLDLSTELLALPDQLAGCRDADRAASGG